jgi:hypothetical protein
MLDFNEAIDSLRQKQLLPTTLSSTEISQLSVQLRERSLFSARVTDAHILQTIQDSITDLSNGQTSMADARLAIKQAIEATGYQPAPEHEGTISDLRTEQRLNLIVQTNADMAKGYGQYQQAQGLIDMYPAMRLFRLESRNVPRSWWERCKEAIISTGSNAVFTETDPNSPQMVALVNDPVWTAISAFGVPYPPYDYNSGMWTEPVSLEEAFGLGLIKPGDDIPPAEVADFNQGVQAEPPAQGELLNALVGSGGYKVENGVLSLS